MSRYDPDNVDRAADALVIAFANNPCGDTQALTDAVTVHTANLTEDELRRVIRFLTGFAMGCVNRMNWTTA